MSPTLLNQGHQLLQQVRSINAYLTKPNSYIPKNETHKLLDQLREFTSGSVDRIPRTTSELFADELYRQIKIETRDLEIKLAPLTPTWKEIVEQYGITQQDLDSIKTWLDSHKDQIIAANENRFQATKNEAFRAQTPVNTTQYRKEVEDLLAYHIDKIKQFLIKHFSHIPRLSQTLREYSITIDLEKGRSWMNWISKVVGLSASAATYITNQKVHVIPEALIYLFGHEVLGHCCSYVTTEHDSEIPQFLKTPGGSGTAGTTESIAQYFQSRIFTYISQHRQFESELGFSETFDSIYTRYQQTELLKTYGLKIYQFSILTLAQSTGKDLKKLHQQISAYCWLNPGYAASFINQHRDSWCVLTQRLNPQLASELRYCATPVQTAFSSIKDSQLETAEKLLHRGFWTPVGIQQWIKLGIGQQNNS